MRKSAVGEGMAIILVMQIGSVIDAKPRALMARCPLRYSYSNQTSSSPTTGTPLETGPSVDRFH